MAIGVGLALTIVWGTYRLNARFGSHGLMKRMARARLPRRITHRRRVRRLLTINLTPDEK